jgi:hypothetical protein
VDPPPQLRQQHHLHILVFEKDRLPGPRHGCSAMRTVQGSG